MDIAYCVGYIDKTSGMVLGASVFSEPTPTTMGNHHTFVLFEMPGDSYADASEAAERHLAHPSYDWLGPVSPGSGRFVRQRMADGRQAV